MRRPAVPPRSRPTPAMLVPTRERPRGSSIAAARPRRWQRLRLTAASVLLGLAGLVPFASAQTGPLWIALDPMPPGTPADVILLPNSSPTSTTFEVSIHGFWRWNRMGPDQVPYQQISVPGLQSILQIGAPELPVLRFDLGIVTGAPNAVLSEVQVLSQQVLPGFHPWPHAIESPPDTTPAPEDFIRDPLIYVDPHDYPPQLPIGGPASRLSGTLFASSCEVRPVRWNPSDLLTVDQHVRYTFTHAGVPVPAETANERTASAAVARLLNGPILNPWCTFDPLTYSGEFLFIYPAQYEEEIAPLVLQKRTRGYKVSTGVVEDIGPTCSQIRSYIESWYAGSAKKGDHFCILVGDVGWIPTCATAAYPPPVGGPIQTDDLYADADGDGADDLWEEVYVGRLSVSTESDCSNQVARILAYEDHPTHLQEYGNAALVAWRNAAQGDDDRFEAVQDEVAAYPYSTSATFDKIYGSNPLSTNAVVNGIIDDAGILCYEGHGCDFGWWSWNTLSQNYYFDFLGVTNAPATPVVWSLACDTGNINANDCMAENWMSHGSSGSVAVYAATRPAYIAGNVVLNRELFKAVFDKGITTHAKAIEWAESKCTPVDNVYNELEYLLLGDPEMEIRRANVPVNFDGPFILFHPPIVTVGCDFGWDCCPQCTGTPFDVVVKDPLGAPVQGVMVTLFKEPPAPAAAGASAASAQRRSPATPTQALPNEVLQNGYTDAAGHVVFTLPLLAEGTLFVTARDFQGGVTTDQVPVTYLGGVSPLAGGPSLRLSAVPSVMTDRTTIQFGGPLEHEGTVDVFDVNGRRIRALRAARGTQSVGWDGTDDAGGLVSPGLYLARLSDRMEAGCVRITRLR